MILSIPRDAENAERLAQARLVLQTLEIAAPNGGVIETILVLAGERFARDAMLGRVVRL